MSFYFSLILLALQGAPQERAIVYQISFDNAAHHEARVTVTYRNLPPGPLELRMSRSSPGRYALHDFARHVYDLRAHNGAHKALEIKRPNPHQWNVTGHNGTVIVSYTLFGNRADGTYTSINESHAHLNMPATFIWARGTEPRPVHINFVPRDGWKIATQLVPTDQEYVFEAPNLQYFMDSPTELSDFHFAQWQVLGKNNYEATIRLAVHHEGSEAEFKVYVALAKAVVKEQQALFGELPIFDYGTYTFIADYLPHAKFDGMEHRNSTILTHPSSLKDDVIDQIWTLSHELIHSWNVERIRPASLEPFNFEGMNMSGELWFSEGFTSYYDSLVLSRLKLWGIDAYLEQLANMLNYVTNSPARNVHSAVQMSQLAPLRDGAQWVDPNNTPNTYISYYSLGSAIALGLDLTLRARSDYYSLDDFMRAVWHAYGRKEIPYTNDDLATQLGIVTGDPAFAQEFFARYIKGREQLDYKALLRQMGLLLRPADDKRAYLGAALLEYSETSAKIVSPTHRGSPLYVAGLDSGDEILAIGEQKILSEEDLEKLIEAHEPGQILTMEIRKQGEEGTVTITLGTDPKLELVTYERAGLKPTTDMLKKRQHWLAPLTKPEPLKRICPKCRLKFPFAYAHCPYDAEKLVLAVTYAEDE